MSPIQTWHIRHHNLHNASMSYPMVSSTYIYWSNCSHRVHVNGSIHNKVIHNVWISGPTLEVFSQVSVYVRRRARNLYIHSGTRMCHYDILVKTIWPHGMFKSSFTSHEKAVYALLAYKIHKNLSKYLKHSGSVDHCRWDLFHTKLYASQFMFLW